MKQRTAAIVAGGIASLALVAGIVFAVAQGGGTICTMSLYVPSQSIVLSGDTSVVRGVELCTSAACSFDDGPTASPTPLPSDDTSSTAAPGSTRPIYAYQVNGHGWQVPFTGDRPDAASRVIVRGDGGRVLVAKSFTMHWTQVGKTSVCGNAHVTPVVHVLLPKP